MGEEETIPIHKQEVQETHQPKHGIYTAVCRPVYWFKMLALELHWSFVFGVVIVYGISQGLGGALARVGTQYYMKDVQKVQPSEAQVYSGITSIPWIVKPLWGLLTDVVPILGYHRRPYFLFAGFLGVISMLFLSSHEKLHIILTLMSLTAASASVAIADVTVDACVAQNSSNHPSLAADMQSLCALSASIGLLVGFSLSGIFVHLIGPQGVFGLLAIPAGLVLLVGVLLKENKTSSFAYQQINQNFLDAGKAMWKTLKCPGCVEAMFIHVLVLLIEFKYLRRNVLLGNRFKGRAIIFSGNHWLYNGDWLRRLSVGSYTISIWIKELPIS
ncbi:putative folate-biopterin transporter 2 [Abeliophyllum distichum]|uniref:Folate-biopterin transporter 2 n=1 Tax=Abeliophyllum distichum TaxID=126358 RepID=A0ABD1TXL8_9LAMI